MIEKPTYEDLERRVNELEASLKKQQNVLQLFDHAPNGIFLIDLGGKVLYANESGAKRLNKTPEEILGTLLRGYFPDDIGQKRQLKGMAALKTGKPQRVEDRVEDKCYSSTIFPIKDATTNEERLAIFGADITEQKNAEQALRDSEEKYRVTFESITDSITVTRMADGRYRYVNDGFCHQTGYLREEVLGKTPFELNMYVNPEERERFIETLKRTGKVENVVLSLRRKSGEIYYSEFSGKPISYAGEECLLAQSKDISDRKRAEDALQESERYLSTILQTAVDGFWVLDHTGRVMDVNSAYCAMSGYTRDEMIGLKISELDAVESTKETAARIEAVMSKGSDTFETKHRRKDGTVWPVEISTTYLKAYGGRFVCFCRDLTERNNSLEKLRDQEELLSMILDATEDGILLGHSDGSFSYTNNRFVQMWHISDAAIATGDRAALHQEVLRQLEDPDGFIESLRKAYLSNESVMGLLHFKDGRVFQRFSKPVLKNGQVMGRLWSFRDITKQKEAEERLKETQRQLSTLMSNLPGMAYRCRNDRNWTMMFVSEGCFSLTGYKAEDLVGDTNVSYGSLIKESDRHMVWDAIQTALRNKSPFNLTYRIHRADRREVWVWEQGQGVFDVHGNVIALEGFITDITEKKQTEVALKKSEEKYRAIFENKGTATGIFGDDRTILECNAVFEELSGYSRSEIIDKKKWSDFVVQEDLDRMLLYHAKRLNEGDPPPSQYECRIMNKADQIKTVIVNVNLVGKNRIVSLTDISDRKQAEKERERLQAQLLQAQKMESIGTLAGGIAHDFNNILASILGYSELTLMDLPAESPIRNKLEAIYTSAVRARDLVAQILSFSRKDDQVRSPIKLHLMIEDALKLLRPAIPSTIRIRTQIDAACRIMGDPSRIDQVIMNLCTNAYQAMLETGGTLGISLSRTEMDGEITGLTGLPRGFYAKLIISDTGIGIPPKDLERIFEPYFTTKEKGKGTGLGLAVVHGIVKSHKGTILVESQAGKGAEFYVYLPLTGPGLDQDTNGLEVHVNGGSEQILLVDDQEDVLDIEKKMLERLGYKTMATTSVRNALRLFSRQPHRFDVVITDMTMPDMTGDKLAGELRKIRSDIPIILITGYSQLINKEKAESMGINGFLIKPVQMSHMAKAVRKVIDERSK